MSARRYVVIWRNGGVVMARSRTKGLANPYNGAGTLFTTRTAAKRAVRRAEKAWGDPSGTYTVQPVGAGAKAW